MSFFPKAQYNRCRSQPLCTSHEANKESDLFTIALPLTSSILAVRTVRDKRHRSHAPCTNDGEIDELLNHVFQNSRAGFDFLSNANVPKRPPRSETTGTRRAVVARRSRTGTKRAFGVRASAKSFPCARVRVFIIV
ncbi:hypothetical protein EVAR_5767_1 [Eumeta japonica]|uniref:Uncharacterized protein n=1 Tax=Eumeta variegata TaxID=151549 RepID=A0A4C1T7C4_EUMVA|nr:hypothetical protein EVAR_5767_1 [Eumeta japonica]